MILMQAIAAVYLLIFIQQDDFLNRQNIFPRVRQAITEKQEKINVLFMDKNIDFPAEKIYIRAFKENQVLELWAQAADTDTFAFIKKYPFCSTSGRPGPKRRQGDLQIPEGFYHIDRFNPSSNFHLSLGINYPNASDKVLGEKSRLGGDIFIHGNCVTIGCIPITDELIKELYVIAIFTKNNGQLNIPVHIFPFKMTENKLDSMNRSYPQNSLFWNNLAAGYSYFEEHHMVPSADVDSVSGRYLFSD